MTFVAWCVEMVLELMETKYGYPPSPAHRDKPEPEDEEREDLPAA